MVELGLQLVVRLLGQPDGLLLVFRHPTSLATHGDQCQHCAVERLSSTVQPFTTAEVARRRVTRSIGLSTTASVLAATATSLLADRLEVGGLGHDPAGRRRDRDRAVRR